MKKIAAYIAKILEQKWWICVLLAMLASLLLTLFMGKGQDVWFDESYSIIIAQKPLDQLLSLTAVDAHPPLYYVLLKAWGSLFGWSELALRGLSSILAMLTIGVVALMVRKLFSPRIVVASLPLLVLAPFWLRYGYEIRMYALAGLICALASLVLVMAVSRKAGSWWWILYGVLVALGMYTLYMTAVIWLAHVVWLFIYHRRGFWQQQWVRAYALAVLLFLPYMSTFIYQYSHSALPGIGKPLNLTQLGGIESMLFIYTPEWSVGKWSAIGLVASAGLTLFLAYRIYKVASISTRQRFVYIASLALVPIVFYVLLGLAMSQPFFIPRYSAHISLFIYLLVAITIGLGWRYGFRKLAMTLFALTTALLVYGNVQLAQAGNFNFERMYRPEATKIRKMVDCPKSTIVAGDPYMFMDLQYYFDGCDLRFYNSYTLDYQGGYAWLSNSKYQIKSASDIKFKNFVHIYWQDAQSTLKPDNRYRLLSTEQLGKQTIDTYELISE